MRNLLALLGAVVVLFVGLGWFLDWYKLAKLPSNTPGSTRIQFDINQDKIADDISRGVQEGQRQLQNLLERVPSERSVESKLSSGNPTSPDFVGPPAPPNAMTSRLTPAQRD